MSADSIQRFPIVKKGYDPEAVDVYIENLSEKNQFFQGRIMELEKRISLAEDLIESFSKAEDDLRQNIADSKKAAASMILDAKQRAAALLDDARAECGKIVSQLDRVVANRMQVLDVLKNQATSFKDQLFALYGSHIEMIESIASAVESTPFEPNYSGIAEAVNTFEQAGEPEADAPAFTEYPQDSIFPKVEEISVQEEPELETVSEPEAESIPEPQSEPNTHPEQTPEPETAPAKREESVQPAQNSDPDEEDDFFILDANNTTKDTVYAFDTETVDPMADYNNYLDKFINMDEDNNAL
ncbi:MAG: hypothetical protein HFE65_03840 [Clostridiales bacterium]|nr:hypothetical protein [Clostridiales bacterium]